MAAGDLATLSDVKAQMGTSVATSDSVISSLITSASRAIISYTNREFATLAPNPQTRLVDIGPWWRRAGTYGVPVGDIASTPTSVVLVGKDGSTELTFSVADDLIFLPVLRAPHIPWMPITGIRFRSPARYDLTGRQLAITADWGFPQIPEDVRQACVVTVRSWLRSDAASSASYGYDDGGRVISPVPQGGWMLPIAAKQLVESYRVPLIA